jgi:hypothetical protein
MLDSGASHNLMPKVIMEKLGLDITRPYKDRFSFDSRKVKGLGLIKYIVVSLAQIPSKSMVMDVVVADIPSKFGMLLSRSWHAKLKGTLQMDMSYATVPIFGQDIRLYREVLLKYMVSSKDKPNNHHIYSIDTDIGSTIFYIICVSRKMIRMFQRITKYNQFDKRTTRRMKVYGIWTLMKQSTKRDQGQVSGLFLMMLILIQNFVLINCLLIAQITWLNMKLSFWVWAF